MLGQQQHDVDSCGVHEGERELYCLMEFIGFAKTGNGYHVLTRVNLTARRTSAANSSRLLRHGLGPLFHLEFTF